MFFVPKQAIPNISTCSYDLSVFVREHFVYPFMLYSIAVIVVVVAIQRFQKRLLFVVVVDFFYDN